MAICSSMAVAAVPSVDSQLWSELDATHAISADLSATAIVTTRLGNDLPNPALTAVGLQLDYRANSWIASATGYYISIRNADTGAYATVWLPATAITYEYHWGRLTRPTSSSPTSCSMTSPRIAGPAIELRSASSFTYLQMPTCRYFTCVRKTPMARPIVSTSWD